MFFEKYQELGLKRQLYLYSLNGLVSRPAFGAAVSLLTDWGKGAKGQNLEAAACHYLTHNVIPMLQDGGVPSDVVPGWVDRALLHPLEYRPQEVGWKDWMAFFRSDAAFTLEDRPNGAVLLEGLPESAEWAKERNAGVHFVPQALGKAPTKGHVSRRTRDNVEGCLTLLADLDGDKTEGWLKLQSSPILPSVVVETRRGWHAYWPLNDRCEVFMWERVQTTMNEFFMADSAIKYGSHSLRVPGSWHCKEVFEGGEAFYVQLVHATWKRFRFEDMEIAFPPKPLPKAEYRPREYRPIEGVRLPSTNTIPSPGSHDLLVSEAGRVYAGVKQENAGLARKMVTDWYLGFKQNRKPSDELEVQRRCDELEIKQYGSVISR